MKKFNRIKNFILIVILAFVQSCVTQPKVSALDGAAVQYDMGQKAFVFLNVECPISRKYAGSWKIFRRDSIDIYFVFPGEQDNFRIKKLMAYDSIPDHRVILDAKYLFTKHLNATVTPQAVVLDNGLLRYTGKIDDRFENLGSSKPKANVNFVLNAINSLKRNESIEVPNSKPVGCLIERD